MIVVGVTQAKREMERLIERVAAGEVATITRWGKPVARLEPFGGGANGEEPGRSG